MLKLEETKGVIRICELNKDRQHSGQKKNKRTKNDQRNTTQKTKDRKKRAALKTVGEPMCSGSDTLRVTIVTKPVLSHE